MHSDEEERKVSETLSMPNISSTAEKSRTVTLVSSILPEAREPNITSSIIDEDEEEYVVTKLVSSSISQRSKPITKASSRVSPKLAKETKQVPPRVDESEELSESIINLQLTESEASASYLQDSASRMSHLKSADIFILKEVFETHLQ